MLSCWAKAKVSKDELLISGRDLIPVVLVNPLISQMDVQYAEIDGRRN